MSKVTAQSIDEGATPGADESKPEQHGTFRLDALGGVGAALEGPPKRRIPTQAVVMVALVLVAAGALFAMRRLGMGPLSAIAEPPKIEYDYEKAGAGADHRKLLADLSVSHVDHQVPSDQVQKNPFRLPELEKPAVATPTPGKPTKDPEQEAREARAKLIADTLGTLKVHSVLSGSVPVARINDENVRVGDRLATVFTVVAIGQRSVDLQADEQVYTISIDDEVNRGPAGRKPAQPARKK
jgi:hypothetical protein